MIDILIQKSHIRYGRIIWGIIFCCIICIHIGTAVVFSEDGAEIPGDHFADYMNHATNVSANPFPIQFFYNSHCGVCLDSEQYLNVFAANHTDIKIEYHDLQDSQTNNSLYDEYKTKFSQYNNIHYPVIFIGSTGISSSADIREYTKPITEWYQRHAKKDFFSEIISYITTLLQEKK